MLLVLIAVVPAFGLIVYSAIEQRRMATHAALHEAMRLAKSGAATHERMLEGAQQLLITLSQLDEVRRLEASACGIVFSDVLRAHGKDTFTSRSGAPLSVLSALSLIGLRMGTGSGQMPAAVDRHKAKTETDCCAHDRRRGRGEM